METKLVVRHKTPFKVVATVYNNLTEFEQAFGKIFVGDTVHVVNKDVVMQGSASLMAMLEKQLESGDFQTI